LFDFKGFEVFYSLLFLYNNLIKIKNFLTFSRSNFEDEYEIQTNTVDKIFENISLQKALLKIDVEGFEMNVIEGSQMKLKEIPFILLENQLWTGAQGRSDPRDEWSFTSGTLSGTSAGWGLPPEFSISGDFGEDGPGFWGLCCPESAS